jgi:lantibiotic leader peptide-processing serine protease
MEAVMKSARRSHLVLGTLATAMWLGLSHSSTARSFAQSSGNEATLANRFIVVFRSGLLAPGAAGLIEASGGRMVTELDEIGVVIAESNAGEGTQLRQRLLREPAVLDVGHDFVMSAQNDWPHPLPTFSPSLPPDFFYTSTPQQWPAKRIGAAGGGVPTRPGDPTIGAWDLTFGRGVKIAIIDSGINPLHPDLAGQIVFERALSHPTPILGDVNCEVPDPGNPSFDSPVDQVGHGSWTASLAGAALGGGLLVGVAPEAQLLNIKMLRRTPASAEAMKAAGLPVTPYHRCLYGSGFGLASWLIEGLVVATAEEADVISMSLGGLFRRASAETVEPAAFRALHRAANHAAAHGAVLMAAAQNYGLDLDRLGSMLILPAELPNVLAVVAVTNPGCAETSTPFEPCARGQETLASYSNRGARLNALAAPGGAFPLGRCGFSGVPCPETGFVLGACATGIPGTIAPAPDAYPEFGPPPTGTSFGCGSFPHPPLSPAVVPGFDQHMWYMPNIGTSAATPLVAGTAALVKALRPDLGPQQIRTILQDTAQDLGQPGYDQMFNFGMVDAAAAVRRAR